MIKIDQAKEYRLVVKRFLRFFFSLSKPSYYYAPSFLVNERVDMFQLDRHQVRYDERERERTTIKETSQSEPNAKMKEEEKMFSYCSDSRFFFLFVKK